MEPSKQQLKDCMAEKPPKALFLMVRWHAERKEFGRFWIFSKGSAADLIQTKQGLNQFNIVAFYDLRRLNEEDLPLKMET